MADLLGKLLVLRTVQGEFVAAGRCIAQVDAPTVVVETPDGKRIHYREDLCDVLSDEENVVDALSPAKEHHGQCGCGAPSS